MSVPVKTTPEADSQIREVDHWWRKNRLASPDLFVEELIMAFEMVGDAPLIGSLYKQSPIPDTRRVELKRTRYHVYYVPLADEVRILAVWHARRGDGPPIRLSQGKV